MADYWKTKVFKAPKTPADSYDYKGGEFKYLGQDVTPFQKQTRCPSIGKDYALGETIYTVPPGVRFYIQTIFISYIDIDAAGPTPATLYIGVADQDIFFAVRTQTADLYQVAQVFPMPFPYFKPGDEIRIWHIIAVPVTADYLAEVSLLGFHLTTGTPARV
jgi:hypothetical protein